MAERSTYGSTCKDCGHIDFVEDGAAGDVTCQVLSGNSRAGMRQACGRRAAGMRSSHNAHSEVPSSRSKPVQPLQVCGLVAESHTIDVSSEWRTFADSVSKAAFANTLCHNLWTMCTKLLIMLTVLLFFVPGNCIYCCRTSLELTAPVLEALQMTYYQRVELVPPLLLLV